MQTNVSLQPPFSYSIVILILIIICFILAIAYIIYKKVYIVYGERKKKIVVKPIQYESIDEVKQRYIGQLNILENDYNLGKIDSRKLHNNLSKIIRLFTYEMTGIKVQNYSLDEIKMVNIPILYELISECYIPEFSKYSSVGPIDIVDKTRKVIERWN